jgi:hypothetical protein
MRAREARGAGSNIDIARGLYSCSNIPDGRRRGGAGRRVHNLNHRRGS